MSLRAAVLLTTVAVLFLTEASWGLTAYPLNLQPSTNLATEGYLGLSWPSSTGIIKGQKLTLQLSTEPGFKTVYASYNLSQQQQVSLSGLSDGHYYARLVDQSQTPASNIASFTVEHRKLTTAWLLFGLGAILFSLLICTLLLLQKRSAINDHQRTSGGSY